MISFSQQSREHRWYSWLLKRSYISFRIKIMPDFIISWLQKKVSDTAQY